MYANSKEVFLLDLCTLAYQLHAQTLIWPIDPYYDQLSVKSVLVQHVEEQPTLQSALRNKFMANLRGKASDFRRLGQLSGEYYHGPADFVGTAAAGWKPNPDLDPIISQYGRIYPWRPSFTRPAPREWILYNTPKDITSRIKTVDMAIYDPNVGPYSVRPPAPPPPAILVKPPVFPITNPAAAGSDLLYGFEGGTGAIEGWSQTPASWSMMGFVLAEFTGAAANPVNKLGPYDVYIVFRGSRSGMVKLGRFGKYFKRMGNPDWATDLDLRNSDNDSAISVYGSVTRGFGASLKTMLPTIIACLKDLHAKAGPPRTIYVTGHSLGGALAAHFTSAVVLGDNKWCGPYGTGKLMTDAGLQDWPWRSIQLTTFSAPVVGDKMFQRDFDVRVPAGRIRLDGDPITQTVLYGEAVGLDLLVPRRDGKKRPKDMVIDLDSHEPYLIRRNLIQDRHAWRLPTLGVPAPTGSKEKDEPWQVFKSLKDMMDRLTGTGKEGLGFSDTEGFFKDFRDNFVLYVEELISLAAANPEIVKWLRCFQVETESAATMQKLKEALRAKDSPFGRNIFDMWEFTCIGYLMCKASESYGLFTTAITVDFLKDYYANLK